MRDCGARRARPRAAIRLRIGSPPPPSAPPLLSAARALARPSIRNSAHRPAAGAAGRAAPRRAIVGGRRMGGWCQWVVEGVVGGWVGGWVGGDERVGGWVGERSSD